MSFFHWIDPVLDSLSRGKLVRAWVAIGFRIFAVCSILAGFAVLLSFAAIASQMQGFAVLGVLFFGLTWCASIFTQVSILLYRARSIDELPDSNFTVTSILSIVLRYFGEGLAAFLLFIGVGGSVMIWASGLNPGRMIGAFGMLTPSSGSGIFGALSFLILSVSVGAFSLLFFYALAELVVVVVEIANNTAYLKPAAAAMAPAVAAARAAVASRSDFAPPPMPARPQPTHCPRCGNGLSPTAVFCGECGATI